MKSLLAFVLISQFLTINGYKILVITSMPAHSHFTLTFRLAEELSNRNHQVTFVNPYPQKTPIKNLRDVSLDGVIPFVDEIMQELSKNGPLGALGNHWIDRELGTGVTEYVLNNTEVRKLLHSKESFDVVVVEHFFNEALVGLGYLLKAPVVLLESVGCSYRINYIYGNPGPASYVPDLLSAYSKHMNFWQRVNNFLMLNTHEVFTEFFFLPLQRELFKKYVTTEVELEDVLYNVSLILATSHPSVTDAIPHLPNIIEIGGYHLSPPKKLPQELQDFLDNAKEGVVVFSMGSNLKSKDLSVEVRKALLNSFAKIKAKVLWKFETNLPEAPKNVKIMSWLPQQDVLGHKNVKCFITHGGLLSNIEAVYYGVPLIGIPIFGDQFNNVATAMNNGYALSVPLDELTEESFTKALNEILNNPKYMDNVKRRSKFMHDQPLKSIDLAVYWIEHLARHGGAPFLRSAAGDLTWYQRHMIDIILFLILVTVVLFVIFYIIIKKILGLCFAKPKVSKAKKNK